MARKKATGRVAATATGAQAALAKLSSLSKAELDRISLDDLWVMKPLKRSAAVAATAAARRRGYCGCRNVCLV